MPGRAPASICLPLAIQLAAARVAMLPLSLLLGHLDRQLDLLSGPRDAPPRQQSLRATVVLPEPSSPSSTTKNPRSGLAWPASAVPRPKMEVMN